LVINTHVRPPAPSLDAGPQLFAHQESSRIRHAFQCAAALVDAAEAALLASDTEDSGAAFAPGGAAAPRAAVATVREYVDLADGTGLTALHYAAFAGDLRVVALLLGLGAHPARSDPDGRTSLHILAATYGPARPAEADDALRNAAVCG
jgi:hypothetical protein